ncbi:hypothetical protein [Bradyrhizobium sp. USDA 4452]
MSVKESVTGTAKRLIGEIVGDGRLADEGARQAAAGIPAVAYRATPQVPEEPTTQRRDYRNASELRHGDEVRFAAVLGRAALKAWADLPRDAQERLFAAAVDSGVVANELAEFLHDRHPKTAHPPRPTRLA